MKIALICDTHCGARNSSDIFLDNADTFYTEVFFPHCEANDIKQIIHLGDYYDNRKQINIKALHANRKSFLNRLRSNGMKMDIILGNHDVYFKNTNRVNSLKEFLCYFDDEINVIEEPVNKRYGNLDIALLPWINQENQESSLKFVAENTAPYLMGHLELQGFEVVPGVFMKHGMSPNLFKHFKQVFSGHYHINSSDKNINYIGAQLEFNWGDAHIDKFFYVLDTETEEITKVKNPHRLFEKVKYDDRNDYSNFDFSVFNNKFIKVDVIHNKDADKLNDFISNIEKQKVIHNLKINESYSTLNDVDDDDISIKDTRELLNSYIDASEFPAGLEKEKIKMKLGNLLTEAENSDVY